MNSEVKILGDVTNYIARGITPSYDEEGVLVINQKCIRDKSVNFNEARITNPIKKKITEEKFIQKYDVLVNSTGVGTLGRVAQIKKEPNGPITADSHVTIVRPDQKIINGLYFGYAMINAEPHITFLGEGSTGQIELSRKRLASEIEINVPTLPIQKKIASILSSVDLKIDLNNQINQTLEAIGQAIFRHWFVHYEFPNEGQPYKSSGGEMVDSELGEIPVEWEVKPLDEIAYFLNGLALQKYPQKYDDYLPVIKIRELKQGITSQTDKASPDIPEQYIIEDGDVLFSWSGSLEVVLWGEGKGALNQHLFKVSSEDYPKWFYYYQTLRFLPSFRQTAADKATTMGHIKRIHLTESLVAIPPKEIIFKANQLFTPLLEKIILNKVESRNLMLLRDALLPKLMSGKIRVKPHEGATAK